MKRFVFSLQTVLDVQRIHEDRLRAELASLCYQEGEAERHLAHLRQQHIALYDRLTEGGAPVTGADLLATARLDENLHRAIRDSDRRRRDLARQREDKAEETQQVLLQRKMLENLREKAWMRHLYEAQAAAERHSDEVCARRRPSPVAG